MLMFGAPTREVDVWGGWAILSFTAEVVLVEKVGDVDGVGDNGDVGVVVGVTPSWKLFSTVVLGIK